MCVAVGAGKGKVVMMAGLWGWFQVCVECCVSQSWEIIWDNLVLKITEILSQRCFRQYSLPHHPAFFRIYSSGSNNNS